MMQIMSWSAGLKRILCCCVGALPAGGGGMTHHRRLMFDVRDQGEPAAAQPAVRMTRKEKGETRERAPPGALDPPC